MNGWKISHACFVRALLLHVCYSISAGEGHLWRADNGKDGSDLLVRSRALFSWFYLVQCLVMRYATNERVYTSMRFTKSWLDVSSGVPSYMWTAWLVNPLPTNDAYMCHGCSHFFHKAMGIYMEGLTLDANTMYVDICFFKPFLHTWLWLVEG